MATFTVAAIQVAYDDVESIADRITRVSDLVRATAAEHAGLDLIVLPELWAPTGFDYERWESAAEPLGGPFRSGHPSRHGAARARAADLLAGRDGLAVGHGRE